MQVLVGGRWLKGISVYLGERVPEGVKRQFLKSVTLGRRRNYYAKFRNDGEM
jgi:hypothetical protein